MNSGVLEVAENKELGEELREKTLGTRLEFRRWGATKSASQESHRLAADALAGDREWFRVSKRLIRSKRKEWQALTRAIGEIRKYWYEHTVPWVEDGVRLLKKGNYEEFKERSGELRAAVLDAAVEVDKVRGELVEEARERLGSSFCEADYPAHFDGEFDVIISLGVPLGQPDDALYQIDPARYARESERFSRRLQEAAENCERLLAQQLADMVNHLLEKLRPDENGERPQFTYRSVENVKDFFKKYRELRVSEGGALEEVISQAEGLLGGKTAQELRSDEEARAEVAKGLAGVREALEEGLKVKPRRKVMRKSRDEQGTVAHAG